MPLQEGCLAIEPQNPMACSILKLHTHPLQVSFELGYLHLIKTPLPHDGNITI